MRARPDLIEIQRSGDSTGDTSRAEIDPQDMAPEVARAIALVTGELRSSQAAPPPGDPGRRSYDVIFHYAEKREHLRYGENELPDEARAVFDALLSSAGPEAH